MLKRRTNPASAHLASGSSATADASAAVVRLAAERPLGSGSLRSRMERAFLRSTRRGVWAYLLLVLVVFSILQWETDRWWLATIMSLGPKWPGLLPLAILVPLATLLRARLLLPLCASVLLYLFGIMGLCVPWPWQAAAPAGQPVTVLTCSVDETVEWQIVRQLIEREEVDVIALQELSPAREPVAWPEQWQVERVEGLTLAARFPILSQRTWRRESLPSTLPRAVAFYAVIDHPDGPIAICNVHLGSPLNEKDDLLEQASINNLTRPHQIQRINFWRDRESELLTEWIRTLPQVDLIVGDFNMPVESQIYRRWWAAYTNAFSTVGSGFGWTLKDSISKINFGVRIDHVLVARNWVPESCEIGPEVGSNHLPVLVRIGPNSQR